MTQKLQSFKTGRSLKIGMISSIIERVPPEKYGGTERVVYTLTEELVKRGHEVTLFATADSKTSAELVSTYPRALRKAKVNDLYGLNVWTTLNIGLAYAQHQQFDIIHDHTDPFGAALANLVDIPVVLTKHGPFSSEYKKLFTTFQKPYLVSISDSQAKNVSDLNYMGTVYNGLKMDHYPFSQKNRGYLLFVGRISMEKGVHHAIKAAQILNLPLIIAAKLDRVDIPYFKEYIEPQLSEQIVWVGEVDEKERNQLMSHALAFLHPVTWPEPFGLTLIESMACGCPVIAFDMGSIPEIVANGKTGFVVKDVDEMVEAVSNIGKISRRTCREYSLDNFNEQRMTDGYEDVYYEILDKSKRPTLPKPPVYYYAQKTDS